MNEEVWLLAIGTGKEIIVVTGADNKFTFARRFPCNPPPVPKMRGEISSYIFVCLCVRLCVRLWYMCYAHLYSKQFIHKISCS